MGKKSVTCDLFANPYGYFEERLLGFHAVVYIPSDLERWILSMVWLKIRKEGPCSKDEFCCFRNKMQLTKSPFTTSSQCPSVHTQIK